MMLTVLLLYRKGKITRKSPAPTKACLAKKRYDAERILNVINEGQRWQFP